MAMSVELGPFFHEHCHPQVPFVGRSDVVARLLQTLRLIAQSNCNPVLITGATGTGKELAAMMVHQWRCGEKRFVGVNFAALTANLLESELFGHVRGAFTGADRDKTGLLEAAEGGSLFLDEVSEMPSDLQAKLLRMLQEKTFRKVGGTTEIACNVTIIASSNRNLLNKVKNGRFRQEPLLPPGGVSRGTARAGHDRPAGGHRTAGQVFHRHLHDRAGPPGRYTGAGGDGAAVEPRLAGQCSRTQKRHRAGDDPDAKRRDSGREHHHRPAGWPVARGGAAGFAGRGFLSRKRRATAHHRALREANWQRTRTAGLLGITRAALLAKIKRYEIQPPAARPAPVSADEISSAG